MMGGSASAESKNNPGKSTGKRGGARPGAGRPKGVPNKLNAKVKDMILAALDKAGGEDYLLQQAHDEPKSFMALLGRVLPLQLTGEDGGAIRHEVIRKIVDTRK